MQTRKNPQEIINQLNQLNQQNQLSQRQRSQLNRLDELLNSEPETITPKDLHKYVWGLVGIFFLFIASAPTAWSRVAHNEKFGTQPVHSLDWNENQKAHLAYPDPEKK
jgi:hypothetical protein